ncbi:MAG: glycosyltransferase [Planctomycetota bacterium]
MSESQTAATPAPARVFFLQPQVEHYRIPIWDGLVERGAGRYSIEVYGPLNDGRAFGGEARPYLRGLDYREKSVLGKTMFYWPGLFKMLRASEPDVVISAVGLRYLDCWRLPRVCRSFGAVPIGWGKAHSVSELPPFLLSLAKKRMYQSFELLIAYGQLTRREFLEAGVREENTFVAQNTIDTRRIFCEGDAIRRRGEALREAAGLRGRCVLLCIARFNEDKRHRDLLAAWPRLRELDDGLRLVLVGGGPLLESIREQAATIDPERILVTGRVPEGDDYAWVSTASYNIQPGAVGLAINQSLAFGVPTIIADEVGSDTEIVEHRVTGWRYPRGDLDALVSLIEELHADEPHRKEVVGRAVQRMRDEVTIDNMVDRIDAAIRLALKRQPKT